MIHDRALKERGNVLINFKQQSRDEICVALYKLRTHVFTFGYEKYRGPVGNAIRIESCSGRALNCPPAKDYITLHL